MKGRISSYEEFGPLRLAAHEAIHARWPFAGTTAVLGLAAGVAASPWWLVAAPFLGYGPAWIGHFLLERNRPATFTYPLWSLRGDFRMYRLCSWLECGPRSTARQSSTRRPRPRRRS